MSGAVDWPNIAIEEVGPGVSRQTMQGEVSTVVRYVYAPGAIFVTHSHPEEQTTIVLSGMIAFTLNGVERIFGPGDCLIVGPNIPHGARVIGDKTVESINVLAPKRVASPPSLQAP